MTLRSTLSLSITLLALLALGALLWLFLGSLRQTEAALLSHQMEIDLKNLAPGQAMKVIWENTEVFILHRSPEQIEWLKQYVPPVLNEAARPGALPAGFDETYRSIDQRYLVVGVWKNGSRLMLPENQHHWSLCNEFSYHPTKLRITAQLSLPGAFMCMHAYSEPLNNPERNPWIYDPAGRSISRWISPLEIPPHRLDGLRLTLGVKN